MGKGVLFRGPQFREVFRCDIFLANYRTQDLISVELTSLATTREEDQDLTICDLQQFHFHFHLQTHPPNTCTLYTVNCCIILKKQNVLMKILFKIIISSKHYIKVESRTIVSIATHHARVCIDSRDGERVCYT